MRTQLRFFLILAPPPDAQSSRAPCRATAKPGRWAYGRTRGQMRGPEVPALGA